MSYKYSVCYPDKEDIQYFDNPISEKEVISIAQNFKWIEQLRLIELLREDKIFYAPSLDFTCISNQKSFCLTAEFNDKKQLEFSLWYCRPKKVKKLFGLFGETEKMVVDDVENFTFDEAIEYLKHFVNKNYQVIENLYEQ